MPNVRDPMNQRDTIYFKTIDGEHPCTESSKTLYFCKRFPDHIKIRLTALKQNSRAVELKYDETIADDIFDRHPGSPFTLRPGKTETFKIKKHIGSLEHRPDFGPHDPRYSRVLKFDIDDRCHHILSRDDVHVEC